MNKNAFIEDNSGNLMQAIIDIKQDSISIRMFDISFKLLGYINIQIQKNNRLFLSEIYCYDVFRGNGIGTKLSELADYILKDYQGYILRGIYYPTQMSKDLNNIDRSKEELDERATNFYEKNGFGILKYEDYINNKEEYEFLDEKLDFTINGQIINEIVYKLIQEKNYKFYEDNGLIFDVKKDKKL